MGEKTLLDALRSERGVRSASRGCTDGTCGACRVLVDGALVKSCLLRQDEVAEDARVEAHEDVAEEPAAVCAVAAFDQDRPTRCKLCVGALAVSAVSLARRGLAGDAGAVEEVLDGASCACTGRGSLRRALLARPT